jgi:hypothetical protein
MRGPGLQWHAKHAAKIGHDLYWQRRRRRRGIPSHRGLSQLPPLASGLDPARESGTGIEAKIGGSDIHARQKISSTFGLKNDATALTVENELSQRPWSHYITS